VILPDARTAWQDEPAMRPFVDGINDEHLHGVLLVPLSWDNQVTGVLALHLPPGVATPDETEVAFCTALADHGSVAVINSRLARRIGHQASARERERLARELHDTVSQSLFAMTLHARAAQLAMRSTDVPAGAPLAGSVEQLAGLAQDALAEMRTLILQLRPEGLTEQGLVGALTTRANVVSRREDVTVEVDGPGQRLTLTPEVESHLYRIVTEALHNVVKHARAERAVISLRVDGDVLVIRVVDDGRGLDPAATTTGLGLTTMAARARAVGAEFTVTSDRGTTVSVRVPLPAGDTSGGDGG
jgi:signal transduction histidine kinase